LKYSFHIDDSGMTCKIMRALSTPLTLSGERGEFVRQVANGIPIIFTAFVKALATISFSMRLEA
jgi:hypothetical protein